MRRLLPVVALVAALVVTADGRAQAPPKVTINTGGVRVGFPSAGGSFGLKVGAWAPVYVDLTASRLGRLSPGDGSVVVETADADDVPTVYKTPFPPLEPEEQATVLTYVRLGNVGSDVRVRLLDSNGREVDAQKARNGSYSPAPPGAYLYLTLGRNSYLLQRALHPTKAPPPPDAVPEGGPEKDLTLPANGPVEQEDIYHPDAFAHVEQAGVGATTLPSRWFGYRSADTIILYTAAPGFTRELLDERSGRKEALAEWVRRGGRLVISAGHEHQLVKALLEKMQIIGVTIDGVVQRPSLETPAQWAGVPGRIAGKPRAVKAGAPPQVPEFEVLKLDITPNRGVQVVRTEPPSDKDPVARPLILEAPCGLGRVILVAFDLDQRPFLDWNFQSLSKFWHQMNTELRPNQAREQTQANPNPNWGGMGNDSSRGDVSTLMQDRLESFDEVPVISFGWVALFILIYIIIVGPLDYFFLKKVVKRLELTWITFPAVVLTVSAVAYVSAYYLKGNDLRINKVDVVDVVAEPAGASGAALGAHAYGSTWFTLFSPRIQNYTVGVEPAGPSWVPDALADRSATNANPNAVLTGWMGRPENAWGGAGRTGSSPGLFGRRPYQYAPDAAALEGVPIQVWSTKSFTASWQAALPEDRPLFEAELTRSGPKGEHIGGTLTSRLPVGLDNAVLFYHNQRYDLGRLEPGAPRKLDDLSVGLPGGPQRGVEQWFADVQVPVQATDPWNRRYGPVQHYSDAYGIVKELMFGAADDNTSRPHNSSLRYLDATWRLRHGEELIVVGRLPRQVAAAEQVSQAPATPTRLWLGQVPAPGETRRPLAGKLSQETYVRVFIPVPPK